MARISLRASVIRGRGGISVTTAATTCSGEEHRRECTATGAVPPLKVKSGRSTWGKNQDEGEQRQFEPEEDQPPALHERQLRALQESYWTRCPVSIRRQAVS
jgi:hypothetical protein